MPYLIEKIKTGKVMEVRKKYSARYGIKGIPRSDNCNLTPEDVEKINQDNAERKLRWKLNSNFEEGDFHIVLGYSGTRNPTQQEAIADYNLFIRHARSLYRSEGKEFKFISVMERGQRGEKKVHFHMVVNYIGTKKLSAIWPWGRIKFFPLDDTGQYSKLASYLIKQTSKTFKAGKGFKKRFNTSRNLEIPVPKNKVVSHSKWLKEPKAVWGYYIEKEKTVNGISQKTGYPYQFYSMVQIPNMRDHKKTKKRE